MSKVLLMDKEELRRVIKKSIEEWDFLFGEDSWNQHDITVYVLQELGCGVYTEAEYRAVFDLV